MEGMRERIVNRALLCIDEAYPADEEVDAAFFPVHRFVDEAARLLLPVVPRRLLGKGKPLPVEDFKPRGDGSGSLRLPGDFVRLLCFRMKGWQRTVTEAIDETDPRYAQQFNRVLRGGEAKPVVAVCRGAGRIEYFSSRAGAAAKVDEAYYVGFDTVDDTYPESMVDVTAWKVAELVLGVMNDAGPMQICAARVAELLQMS